MCWVLVLLLFWFMMIVCTYMIFYYESANGPHLELMRSKGSVPFLLLRGFFWNLYSHVALAALAITGLHRKFWQLPSEPGSRTPIIFVHGLFHNRTAWFLYMRWFRKWGWQHVKAVNLTGKFGSIKDFAQILAREIDEVLAETGSDLKLVNHGSTHIEFCEAESAEDRNPGKPSRRFEDGGFHYRCRGKRNASWQLLSSVSKPWGQSGS